MFNVYFSHRVNKISDIVNDKVYHHNYSMAGEEIRAYLIDWEKMNGFPKIKLYIPDDHFEFIKRAYLLGYMSEEQILNVDCNIISGCDLLISFGNHCDSTMVAEMRHARENGIPVYSMPSLSKESIESLRFTIKCILRMGEE